MAFTEQTAIPGTKIYWIPIALTSRAIASPKFFISTGYWRAFTKTWFLCLKGIINILTIDQINSKLQVIIFPHIFQWKRAARGLLVSDESQRRCWRSYWEGENVKVKRESVCVCVGCDETLTLASSSSFCWRSSASCSSKSSAHCNYHQVTPDSSGCELATVLFYFPASEDSTRSMAWASTLSSPSTPDHLMLGMPLRPWRLLYSFGL